MPDGNFDGSEMPDHRGGAWKVAYADFVTALMALFIVLWLMNSSASVRDAIGKYFRDPKGYSRLVGSARAGMGEGMPVTAQNMSSLKQRLERAMRTAPEFRRIANYVNFTVTGEGLRIELQENKDGVFFETGSPRPTDSGEKMFRMLARELATMSNALAIEGHTDSRPYHSSALDAYGNWELSFDRANMARRIMLSFGVRPEQISEIRGYADKQPLTKDPTEARNRRVSIVVQYPQSQ